MKITYHGHSCFRVEDAGHAIIIDPFLSGNDKADVKPEDVKVEAVLLTHGHADHILDAETIARNNDALIVAPFELAGYYGQKGLKIHPMHLGGKRTFPFGTVKLTLAFHGVGLEAPDAVGTAGHPCGFLVTMGGKTFYHAGDTALFGDMKLIGDLNKVDAAALPIGDNFTMGPEDAAIAAEWVHAGVTIPMHYNTFDLIRQDPQSFVSTLAAKKLAANALQPGQSVEV